MDAPAGEIVLPKQLSDLRAQLDGLTVPRHCASMDSCAKLPIKDTVDVSRGKTWVICQQIVDGLLYLCKTSCGILELKQLLDAKELTTFEYSLVLVVNNDIAIRRVLLTDKDQAYAKLPLHCCCQFLFVGTEATVFLQNYYRVTFVSLVPV